MAPESSSKEVRRYPTPTARLGGKRGLPGLRTALERNASHRRNLEDSVVAIEGQQTRGGQLNPTWVEWLMGFPTGWTDCAASETP